MRSTLKPNVRMADKLAREFVFARDQYRCLACGSDQDLEWAHIITKGMGSGSRYIRWNPDNAVTLCHTDHVHFTEHPAAFKAWIAGLNGPDHWDGLLRLQAAAERRGDRIDVGAVIRSFGHLTPAESTRYSEGDW